MIKGSADLPFVEPFFSLWIVYQGMLIELLVFVMSPLQG